MRTIEEIKADIEDLREQFKDACYMEIDSRANVLMRAIENLQNELKQAEQALRDGGAK